MGWIRESNLIENVNDVKEDKRSLKAWNWLIKQKELDLRVILLLHKKIMIKLYPSIAGKMRKKNVVLKQGEVIIQKFLDWRFVSGLLNEWIKKANKSHVWNKIIQDHIEFELIHPFIDGNGRTGRMLMNWQRVKSGMEPLLLKASERHEYYKWFKN